MTKKVWHLKYVVGNQRIYSAVVTADDGPYLRSEAIGLCLSQISPTWRCWVEHVTTGKVIAQNDTERAWQAGEIEAA